jgi:acyl-CoA synthetase (AMP-forming)/AMP-acid ligase II
VADARYEALLAEQPATAPDVGDRSPDDHYGLWTGGTTGMPKGVIWRQEDIYLSAIGGNGNAMLGIEPVKDLDDVAARVRTGNPLDGTLTLCPLMHGGGFWLAFSAILSGSFSVLIRDLGFDPDFALRVIGEEHVRLLMTIGDAYARPIVDRLTQAKSGEYDLSSLLVYGSGGAILSPSVKEDLARVLPNTFVHDGFGASETGGQGRLVGTAKDGAPKFEMDAGNVVIADDGTLCEPGDGKVGMLANSGQIPLGYYKDEAKTKATFPVIDGVRYAMPGDLASVDADGSIVVFGRGSVSINSGGEKIFPEEVEKALKSHPAVFDATVVGTPNERFGSQVTAVVELRPEHKGTPPTLADLQEHCRKHLAGYKVPRAVVFVDSTVRSPSGKPDYRWAKDTALAALA